MPGASRSIVINRPVDKVFAFFTTPANDSAWRSHVKDILSQGGPEVGAVVHQTIAGPMGRGISADFEITVYEPLERYAFQVVAGPVRPAGEFRFRPIGDGTEVTFSLAAQVSGLKRFFLEGPVQKSMDGEVAALDKARAILESA
jgi:uncharacterized membrane protein